MNPPEDMQEMIEHLPFYVNGTLAKDLREQIDAALPTSTELREALAQERAIQSHLIAGTEAILEQSEPHYEAREAGVLAEAAAQNSTQTADTTLTQASAEPAAEPAAKPGRLASALALLNPRRWSPAVALTLAVAVPLQAAVIVSQSGNIARLEKENFELASGPGADRDRKDGIVIEVKEDASWTAIADLLDAESLIVVESGAFGVLTVKSGKTGAERDAVIERLKQSPIIVSAEPEA